MYRLRLPSNVARLGVAKSALTWTTSLYYIVFELVPRYVAARSRLTPASAVGRLATDLRREPYARSLFLP
jgi:hypothetical protein